MQCCWLWPPAADRVNKVSGGVEWPDVASSGNCVKGSSHGKLCPRRGNIENVSYERRLRPQEEEKKDLILFYKFSSREKSSNVETKYFIFKNSVKKKK